MIAPVVTEDRVVAAIAAYGPQASAGLVRATEEVARWVSTQAELAELGRQRTRTMEAELRALRAQISPHFIYNSLAAIASFVRTDPDRARELLLEFADFTRYALRRGGAFTTLAEELRNIERYLVLEQARFGDRLRVSLMIAPEVLPGRRCPTWPSSRWWRTPCATAWTARRASATSPSRPPTTAPRPRSASRTTASGRDPEAIRRVLAGQVDSDSVGLGNVDARLRQVYGDDYGLVVETAPGAGTKVTFRVPKYAPGVHASA